MCSSSTYSNWTCRCRAGFLTRQTSARDDARHEWEKRIYRFFSSDSRAVVGPRDEKSIEGKWIFVEREEKCSFSSLMQFEREISQDSGDAVSSRNPIYIFILLLSRISVSSRLFEPSRRWERDATKPIWIGTKHRMKTFNFAEILAKPLDDTPTIDVVGGWCTICKKRSLTFSANLTISHKKSTSSVGWRAWILRDWLSHNSSFLIVVVVVVVVSREPDL